MFFNITVTMLTNVYFWYYESIVCFEYNLNTTFKMLSDHIVQKFFGYIYVYVYISYNILKSNFKEKYIQFFFFIHFSAYIYG